MAAERPSWAPPLRQLGRLLVAVTLLAECGAWALATEEAARGAGLPEDIQGGQQQRQPSLDVEKDTEEAFKIATVKLHALLDLLDESRQHEKKQRDLVDAIHDGLNRPNAQPSRGHTAAASAEQIPSEQVKKKIMKLQEGFTETAAVTLLGRRPDDEDALLLTAPLLGRPGSFVKALFDGHGGHIVARKCSVIAPTFLGKMPDLSGNSFAEASFAMDAALRNDPEVPSGPGSTGIIAVLEAPNPKVPEFILHVANIGDSRLLVLHEDGSFTAMSADQKPNDPAEMARVRKAGGNVLRTAMGVWRIDGRLALSRSFGDFRMKNRTDLLPSQQKVVALPHSRSIKVRPGDVLVFACDGAFEAQGMTWNFVANYVALQLKATGGNLEETAMRLVTTAYLLGSCDNISAMLVRILPTAFPSTTVTAADVDALGVRKERPFMLTSEATVQHSGAWTTEHGLHATLY